MRTPVTLIFSTVAFLLGSAASGQAAGPSCSHHSGGDGSDHHARVNARGDKVMGFDHDKTTHHFLLAAAGGSIEVTANQAEDKESRDAIRGHLAHIATMFSDGNFEAPMLVHDRTPPGVPVMKRKRADIRWKYEEIENGARVVAVTKDPDALSAIHEFLRFQIADHSTGDPGKVPGETHSHED
jgi:hypothetical protein